MNPGWEEIVLYLIFVAGTAGSLFAFFWGRRLRRGGAIPAAIRDDPAFTSFLERTPCIAGEIDVEAPALKPLFDILQLNLENPMNYMQGAWAKATGTPGQLHVERTAESEISFTASGLDVVAGLMRGETVSAGRTVRIRWALQLSGSGSKLIMLGHIWALFVALPASIIGPILVFKYVLSSSNPLVRGQILQVLQIGQVLWEPYLFFGIAAQRMRVAGRYLELLISSAAFEARTGRPSGTGIATLPPASR